MSTNVDEVIRKTKSYWYEDGLAEILAGLFFVAVCLLLLADWQTPAGSPWKAAWSPLLMVFTLVWVVGGRKAIGWLKERITYPRTGYVAYKRVQGSKAARAVLGGVIGAAVSLAVVASLAYRQDIVRVIPLIMGAEFAGTVEKLGAGVTSHALGARVAALPRMGHCGRCLHCRGGREETCAEAVFIGHDVAGAYAEYVIVKPASDGVDAINVPDAKAALPANNPTPAPTPAPWCPPIAAPANAPTAAPRAALFTVL